jgi:DNA polymerase-3 subunit alpha/error-prone DNA polymerase
LSQRGIGHIDDTVKLVAKNRGIQINSGYKISKNEAKANTYLSKGNTIGCFISKVLPCVWIIAPFKM